MTWDDNLVEPSVNLKEVVSVVNGSESASPSGWVTFVIEKVSGSRSGSVAPRRVMRTNLCCGGQSFVFDGFHVRAVGRCVRVGGDSDEDGGRVAAAVPVRDRVAEAVRSGEARVRRRCRRRPRCRRWCRCRRACEGRHRERSPSVSLARTFTFPAVSSGVVRASPTASGR
jgi:hypothetical protein